MAYDIFNPAALVFQSLTGEFKSWVIKNDDTAADAQVAGYVIDGRTLGMKVGEPVAHLQESTGILSQLKVSVVNADGSVDLSDATEIGAANTD